MREVVVAATQMACSLKRAENLARAEALVRRAAGEGAQIILLPELFETPYFPKDQRAEHFALATTLEDSPAVRLLTELARSLGVVLPVSFFERAHKAYFNSLVVIDADGTNLGLYRKAHIPTGPGYQEKYYFSPGDTGFRVFETRYGAIGTAICWDQWFPECARAMALGGAEMLFYPTAIGSEPPPAAPLDSRRHWQRAMQGHAAANMTPLVAANRYGREIGAETEITFYGTSFIADQTGALVGEAPPDEDAVLIARFDLDAIAHERRAWGLFRDRRPELYGALVTFDGGRRR